MMKDSRLGTRSRLISQQASLELVLRYWKDDWAKFKDQNKVQHETLEKLRAQSSDSQKELRTMTKDLNKTINQNELVNGKDHVTPVIKKFISVNQETRSRIKEYENAFDAIFESLEQVHEPVLALEHALTDLEKTKEIENELTETKQSLAEYEEEFQTLKNQDYTVNRLKDENKALIQSMDTRVAEEVEKIKERLQQDSEEIIIKFKERESDTLAQLQMAKEELAQLQLVHETAKGKLLDASMDTARSEALEDSQTQMLFEELERRDSEIVTLKRDKEELKKQLEALHFSDANEDRSDLEDEIVALRENYTDLEQKSEEYRTEAENTIDSLEQTVHSTSQQMSQYELTIESLNQQIKDLPTREAYEKLKKTLSIIQEVEFNAVGDDVSSEQNWHSEFTDAEALLLKKTRKLESELTKTKLDRFKVSDELKDANESLNIKEKTIREHQELITRLEDDLAEASTRVVSPTATQTPASEGSELAAVLTNAVQFEKHSSQLGIAPIETSLRRHSASEQSTLAIVCGQRDRFKQRVQQLEQENQKFRDRSDRAQTDVSHMRQDNVKLYQKLKFVESYQKQPIPQHSQLRNRGDIESGMDATERKYAQLYEEKLNPFAQFNQMEVQKRYRNLNSAEKITLTASNFFLRQKSLRIFAFLYAVALHCLVFFTLYFHTVSPHC